MSNLTLLKKMQDEAAAKAEKAATAELAEWIEERLEELQLIGDLEAAHKEADTLLCRLLTRLGYKNLVAEFEALDRYYG